MASTLRDVADRAGVSIRTAGRALRGTGPVSEEVAVRVRAAASELHYVPNAAARSLRTRSYGIVGVICGNVTDTEFAQRRLVLLESCLREHGYHVLLSGFPESESALVSLLRDWSGLVSHVVFLGWSSTWSASCLSELPQRFLFFDCGIVSLDYAHVVSDRAHGVALAVDALIRSGCRRIAHICREGAEGRRSGVARAVSHADASVQVMELAVDGMEMRHGYGAGDWIVAQHVDGAFFDTDRMALGFYRYAYEHGIRIPRDLAVAGFDDDRAGAFATPTLTSVSHADDEAVESVVAWVSGDGDFSEPVVYPARLIERESSVLTRE